MGKKILRYAILTVFIILLFVIALFSFVTPLNENQILYLSSTLAQVAATLFGLSITGYIFLEDKLTKDSEKDETLIDVIEKLKDTFRHILLTGGIITGIALLFCVFNILMAANDIDSNSHLVQYYFIRCSIIFSAASIFSTFRFVYKTIDPKKLKKISQQGVKDTKFGKVAKENKNKNYLQEFLQEYNQLNRDVDAYIETLLGENYERKTAYKNFYFLKLHEIINDDQFQMLQKIRKFRNYTVHGDTMFVDKPTMDAMNKLSKEIHNALEAHSKK